MKAQAVVGGASRTPFQNALLRDKGSSRALCQQAGCKTLDLSRIHDMQMSSILANHPDRKAIIHPNRMAIALISKSVMDLRDRDPLDALNLCADENASDSIWSRCRFRRSSHFFMIVTKTYCLDLLPRLTA